MHGLTMVPRIAKQDLWIKGFKISKGTTLFASPHMTMNDPLHYDQPDSFIANRFTNEYKEQQNIQQQKEISDPNRNFLPAGLSKWNCPGIGITISMISAFSFRLLKEFDFKVEKFPKPEVSLVVLAPQFPLKVSWNKRQRE